MITITNLTKRYGTFLANDGVNLEVKPGEVSILLGPNGAGKSTLIKCIAGLLKHQGEILICGQKNKSTLAKQFLGYIPEMPALYDMLTIWEHMEFIGRAYNLKDWQLKANQLFERFELEDKKNKLGSELSKGMQQKVSLCCGLLPSPKVLLFDEPLVGLDPHAIKELKSLVVEYRNHGTAILLSTHMLDSVAEFWDSTNIMMNGKIVAYRTRGDMEASGENLEELFFSITEKSKDMSNSNEAKGVRL